MIPRLIFCTLYLSLFWCLIAAKRSRLKDSNHYAYEAVVPAKISPFRSVPDHIPRPPYVYSAAPEVVPKEILIKNATEIEDIAKSCSIARYVLNELVNFVQVGTTTDQIDAFAHQLIIERGAYPSPLNYSEFPKSICTSVNNIAIHGIPDSRKLKEGDIVTLDVTVYYNGFHGDCADTFPVGKVDEDAKELIQATRNVLQIGIDCCKPGVPFYTIGHKISKAAQKMGFAVMPQVMGHGLGRYFHEEPGIDHDEGANLKTLMKPGMVFTIEPALSEGSIKAVIFPDKWTISTEDGSRTAHVEHTIVITETSNRILTK